MDENEVFELYDELSLEFKNFSKEVWEIIYGYPIEEYRDNFVNKMSSIMSKNGIEQMERRVDEIDKYHKEFGIKLFAVNLHDMMIKYCISPFSCKSIARWVNRYTKTDLLFWNVIPMISFHFGTKEKSIEFFVNNISYEEAFDLEDDYLKSFGEIIDLFRGSL